jgi:ATP-dependent protease Clp ATPase subunit
MCANDANNNDTQEHMAALALLAALSDESCPKKSPTLNGKAVRKRPLASRTPSFPSPQSLKAHLDTIVVGQERAKKTLAVAVANHYAGSMAMIDALPTQTWQASSSRRRTFC